MAVRAQHSMTHVDGPDLERIPTLGEFDRLEREVERLRQALAEAYAQLALDGPERQAGALLILRGALGEAG